MQGYVPAINSSVSINVSGATEAELTLLKEENYNIYGRDIERKGNRDVSRYGSWMVSSYKPGHGTENLLDGDYRTFWQSDGKEAHCIDIKFTKCQALSEVGILCDYAGDESYTPRLVYVYAGTGPHDLKPVHRYTLNSPQGWFSLVLDPGTEPKSTTGLVRCFYVRIEVTSNHHDGKDTRIHEVRLVGPALNKTSPLSGCLR